MLYRIHLATSRWQILSHNVVSSTPRHELNSNSQILWWNQNLSYVFIFACKSTDTLLIYQCKHYVLLKTYISRNKYIPQGGTVPKIVERCKISTPNVHIHYYSLQWISADTHRGRRGRARIVVGFTTTYAISAYYHGCCEFESRSGRGVQHYVIKFVSDLRQVDGFLRIFWFTPPIKLTATI